MIAHIAALSENRVIGINGDLPWKISADLKHFKKLTLNKCILMGRKTFASLPSGALPQRYNIVITRDRTFHAPNCTVVHSIEDALKQAQKIATTDIMIIGGADIYQQTLALVDTLFLTLIHEKIIGDAYYPDWSNDFELVESSTHEESNHKFSFCTFRRKN